MDKNCLWLIIRRTIVPFSQLKDIRFSDVQLYYVFCKLSNVDTLPGLFHKVPAFEETSII